MRIPDFAILVTILGAVLGFTFIIALFVHMDGNAKNEVDRECIKSGGNTVVDIKDDGLGERRACIYLNDR